MGFFRPEYWGGYPFPSPGDLLPAESQEKPKNTGVSSLALLQRIFPTQGLNRSLELQADSLPTEL